MHSGYAHLRRYSLCGQGRSHGHRVTKVLETVRRYFHRRELALLVTLTAWSLKSRLLRWSALRVHPRRELICSHSAPFTPQPRLLPKPGRRQLRKSKIDFSAGGTVTVQTRSCRTDSSALEPADADRATGSAACASWFPFHAHDSENVGANPDPPLETHRVRFAALSCNSQRPGKLRLHQAASRLV